MGTAPCCTSNLRTGEGSPPRAWGRRVTVFQNPPKLPGSPPRAWGRLTTTRPARCAFAVHPHGRGDGPHLFRHTFATEGSPPRAWGRRKEKITSRILEAGSPPRAWGRRFMLEQYMGWQKVHPHGRGDGPNRREGGTDGHGSPPRAWGRREEISVVSTHNQVHPHGRGDRKSVV